jgi:hypothetical protein
MFTRVRAKYVAPRHNLSDFPNSDFWFPNSEFRMAYEGSGIPHHETGEVAGDVTGWDMGCLTLECYVNNLAEGRGEPSKEGMAY